MIIKQLSVKNFRNYDYQQIDFEKSVNIIYGNNAQGKTNILESIFLSATSKSQRTKYDREMINFNHSEAHIKSLIEKNNIDYTVDIHLKKTGNKGIAINKMIIDKTSDLFEIIDVVFFSPEDLNIIKSGPSNRRKWMDFKLCSLNKAYYKNLINYNKVLKNRNILLQKAHFNHKLIETLDVWNEQLIHYGTKIILQREKFIKRLNEIITPIHSEISGKIDNLKIEYAKSVTEDIYRNKLFETLKRDEKLGFTSIGPHRDDLIFKINDNDARQFASQGQQKTAIVSLKLSEIDLIFENKKDMPILLLDDVLSELDSKRQTYLLENLKDIQTIITCTGIDEFVKMRYNIDKLFHVENGIIKNINI